MTRRKIKNLNCFNYAVALTHLVNYAGESEVQFNKVTREWFSGLKAYLSRAKGIRTDKHLSVNSANTYFAIVLTVAKQAADERFIEHNVVNDLGNVQPSVKAEVTALSLDELQRLASTDCSVSELKKAFLFSSLTGLGWNDISSLTWNKISVNENDNWEIILQHNHETQLIPISQQARELLSTSGHKSEKVFNVHYTAALSVNLNKWALCAGITKKITFQSARQTFGKMLFDQEVAPELISELLGHKHLKTTLKFLGVKKSAVPLTSNYLRDFTI